jgi:hypothetical protein
MPDKRSELSQAALHYAQDKHWPTFPLKPGGKEPLIPRSQAGNGVHDATTDEATIRAWWANIPTPTSP